MTSQSVCKRCKIFEFEIRMNWYLGWIFCSENLWRVNGLLAQVDALNAHDYPTREVWSQLNDKLNLPPSQQDTDDVNNFVADMKSKVKDADCDVKDAKKRILNVKGPQKKKKTVEADGETSGAEDEESQEEWFKTFQLNCFWFGGTAGKINMDLVINWNHFFFWELFQKEIENEVKHPLRMIRYPISFWNIPIWNPF